jgi:hypothetical protein
MPRATKTKEQPVAIPLSLTHWYSNPINIEQLREILECPVFKVAVATLTAANLPTGLPTLNTLGSPAERMAWLAGYTDFARDLVQLTKPRAEHKELVPWGHIQPTHIEND